MTSTTARQCRQLKVWVLGHGINDALIERLGDARRIADRLEAGVGALVLDTTAESVEPLIARGADRVYVVAMPLGPRASVATAAAVLMHHEACLTFASGDSIGREWAAMLAVRLGWKLISPALMVQVRNHGLEVTALHRSGRLARTVQVTSDEPVMVTLRPGVADALRPDPARQGDWIEIEAVPQPEQRASLETVAPAPADVDIRDAERLVAGGRGLGHKEGFGILRRFAGHIGAGVAASRMAVDLGWIEAARQVGQTGKTVAPQLYIACGISGASHHLDGMSGSQHIVAINTDPEAPIFNIAHLGLVADLYEVLDGIEAQLRE